MTEGGEGTCLAAGTLHLGSARVADLHELDGSGLPFERIGRPPHGPLAALAKWRRQHVPVDAFPRSEVHDGIVVDSALAAAFI